MFQPTARRLAAVGFHGYGTQHEFLRFLRKVPVEVYPLGAVVGFMVSFASYTTFKSFQDKTLRLQPQHRIWD